MTHGVLDERLQEERRDETVQRVRRCDDGRPKAVAKPHLFDGEIIAHQIQLLGQRDLIA